MSSVIITTYAEFLRGTSFVCVSNRNINVNCINLLYLRKMWCQRARGAPEQPNCLDACRHIKCVMVSLTDDDHLDDLLENLMLVIKKTQKHIFHILLITK